MGMVDVSEKEMVSRKAIAEARIILSKRSLDSIKNKNVKKGDVLTFAEAAGLLAVKNVPETIPHCHPIPITSVSIDFEIEENDILCRCTVEAVYKTGVEMEALAGATTALLTIWDTVKYLEKDEDGQYPETRITDIRVVEKRKGNETS